MAPEHRQTNVGLAPEELQGRLLDAERLARYHLAQQLVAGRRTLDAACGTGGGARLLLEAGAASVVGVDPDLAAVGAAQELGLDATFERADVTKLPFAEASFDLAVWLPTGEHAADPARAVDELRRVLASDGLLVFAATSGEQGASGDCLEATPAELQTVLERRFAHVRLLHQQAWTASLIQDGAGFAADGSAPIDVELRKGAARRPLRGGSTIAMASDAALPAVRAAGVIAQAEEYRRWLELLTDQQRAHAEQARALADHAEQDAERLLLHRRLREVEGQLERIVELEHALHDARRDQAAAELQLQTSDGDRRHQLARAERAEGINRDLRASVSWRATRPLRSLKR